MNLGKIKKVYFIGIKGVGMTALAQVFQGLGIKVEGSDTDEKFFTDEVLQRLGVKVNEKFSPKNVPSDIDLAVSSAAYYNPAVRNVEIQEIKDKKIPLLNYAEALGLIFREKRGIAVAGTHGKSTTTAMLGVVLEAAGFDPTVVVGAQVAQWRSNARVGRSEYLAAEADEYRDHFLNYRPQILVLTNIEYDHPDYFKDFNQYQQSFNKIIQRIPSDGLIVARNDLNLSSAKCRVIKYGLPSSRIELRVPGDHNQLNAQAVLSLALELGIDEKIARKALAEFRGISRRFEFRKEIRGITFIDDYAHHPSEIRATLQAARERYPQNKIWAVFQPHTFSRTEALLKDFAQSFERADQIIILDIYGSAREKKGNIHAKDLAGLIKGNVRYIPTVEQSAEYLEKECRSGDVVLTIGAGDVWRLSEAISS